MTEDQRNSFGVEADRDGQLYLRHYMPEGAKATDPWCDWETSIRDCTTLPELDRLAAAHLTEDHRVILDGEHTVMRATTDVYPTMAVHHGVHVQSITAEEAQ
ncbi:hypothetical protein QQG74_09735 [Micromonospora sp. FIMYZ51]|uniref:hypothetical protein n=1 Tax=Micromonospora sp. FIMYZ51 TaxID=3051832 RepID=UPI0031200B10